MEIRNNSLTQEMIDLKKLEILERMTKKDEAKKSEEKKKWYDKEIKSGGLLKLFLLGMLLWPFVGKIYMTLLEKLWQISLH